MERKGREKNYIELAMKNILSKRVMDWGVYHVAMLMKKNGDVIFKKRMGHYGEECYI